MKNLFYLLLILSPLALNAMQRASIDPVKYKGEIPFARLDMSQTTKDFLAKNNIKPPYTLHTILGITANKTYAETKQALDKRIKELDNQIDTSAIPAQEQKALKEYRDFILYLWNEYRAATPYSKIHNS